MFDNAGKTSIQLSGIQVGDTALYEGQTTKVAALDLVRGRMTLESSPEVELIHPYVVPSANIFCVFESIKTIDAVKFLHTTMENDYISDCEKLESGELNAFQVMSDYVRESHTTKISAERTGFTSRVAQRYFANWVKPGDVYFTRFGKDGIYPVILKEVNYPFLTVVYPYDDADRYLDFDNYQLGMLSVVEGIMRREDYATQDEFFAAIQAEAKAKGHGEFNDWLVAKQVSLNFQNGGYATEPEESAEA